MIQIRHSEHLEIANSGEEEKRPDTHPRVGIEGFFTPTPEFLDRLDKIHQSFVRSIELYGTEGMEGMGISLEYLRAYRWDAETQRGVEIGGASVASGENSGRGKARIGGLI